MCVCVCCILSNTSGDDASSSSASVDFCIDSLILWAIVFHDLMDSIDGVDIRVR